MYTIGIDPGADGAMAVYEYGVQQIIHIRDMPIFNMTINKKTRKRIDGVGVLEFLATWQMAGCKLVMIEAVGGRPRQSASAAFVFGYGLGIIYQSCVALRLPIETVAPQTWKRVLKVPGKAEKGDKKTKEFEGMIVNRADELMPDARDMFRSDKLFRGQRALKVDRAEAAMLAKYCGDYQLRVPSRPFLAVDTAIAYQNADIAA
jgi:hypothetical protein